MASRLLGSLVFIVFIAVALMSTSQRLDAQTNDEQAPDANLLPTQAIRALRSGDLKLAVRKTDAMLEQLPNDVRLQRLAGEIYLRAGEAKKSLEQYDASLKVSPQDLPYLWQRGIAQYFAGDFKGGVKQFEVHRTVNPNDVENAAWHFLCLAKAESFEKASKVVLPAPGDARLPMEEVLKMLRTGDTQSVIDRIEAQQDGTRDQAEAEFYGYFYLGLYADAKGDRETALKWMKKSAKDAPGGSMGDIARVYAGYLSKPASEGAKKLGAPKGGDSP